MEESSSLELSVAVISNGQQEIESEGETAQIAGKLVDCAAIKLKSAYRQKYKRSWELDALLRDWLSPFAGDQYAAYCRVCHCKLHAHKKGLLAHAKSSKHKKHVLNPEQEVINGEVSEAGDTSSKKTKKSHFNPQWLDDPLFSPWLRRIPNNNSKALCVACRSVITAGRSELIKHSQAAKHKKAIVDGVPDNLPDFDFDWLDPSYVPPAINSSTSMSVSVVTYSNVNSTNQINTTMPLVETTGINLPEIISHLQEMAPLHLAEEWDNVGLLVEPTLPLKVHNVLLTIDLTEKVLEEALKKKVNLIISYHPPIFKPLKSLTTKGWKEKILITCIENHIAIYSPHTALDAVKGGINDWLIAAYGESQSNPIKQSYADPKGAGHFSNCLDVLVSEGNEITNALSGLENVILTVKRFVFRIETIIKMVFSNEYGGCDVRICCDDRTLAKVVDILSQHPVAQLCSRITKLQPPPLPGQGMGRLCNLMEPLPLYEVVHRTKQHIDQTHVRLALSPRHTRDTKVHSIAVCAGSGASVLRGVKADVFVTGEMSHHEVLDTIHSGSSVILCEHSNTERGYLKNWAEELKTMLGHQTVNIIVSEVDKDPLRVV
ncbi:hypothetical protein B4U79_10972 [Dinothrombium tinctorium]|uniref:NIF3-like protein 1 n=1 Tax=Dinothrombium tinctorium TaxID=1965070 RepID=A0A443R0E5_9ACAR|nr:hypothetical protein B4U79_06157 [Dinothrombium tinctorium]RWS08766.1 hypothetical protein B4U79_10972 [Dinothrombium tinctorium]